MYKHITGTSREEIVINKSRFIGTASYVSSEEEAKSFVDGVRREFSDATHNCFAYIFDTLGNALKFFDDGEPKGTAGMPILEVIRNKKLVLTAVVVTRYFGGIKLGAGGLVRAYTEAAAKALSSARVVIEKEAVTFSLKIDYSLLKIVEEDLSNRENVIVLDKEYSDVVAIKGVASKELFDNLSSELVDICLGKCEVEKIEEGFFAFD